MSRFGGGMTPSLSSAAARRAPGRYAEPVIPVCQRMLGVYLGKVVWVVRGEQAGTDTLHAPNTEQPCAGEHANRRACHATPRLMAPRTAPFQAERK